MASSNNIPIQMFAKYNRLQVEGELLEAGDYGVGFSIMPMQKDGRWAFMFRSRNRESAINAPSLPN